MLGSCVVMSQHTTTGNPIGTKVGFVKSKLIGNFDAGIAAAAKQGGITKIGSVDIKDHSFTGEYYNTDSIPTIILENIAINTTDSTLKGVLKNNMNGLV